MQTHPTVPLQALLNGKPVNYPLDYLPQPWAEVLTALQATAPLPHVRQAALKAALAALPDSYLDILQESLTNPLVLAHHLKLTHSQREIIAAVVVFAPVQISQLVSHLQRDRSNLHRSLQGLVSLGVIARRQTRSRVYYTLSDPFPAK